MDDTKLIPHLFRTEYRKIVSVLCKYFGLGGIENAEDIASETFLTAAQSWGLDGIPANPTAWLYSVAKNKAKNHLQRHHLFQEKITPALDTDASVSHPGEVDLSPSNIIDSQLQMMFTICHPSISGEAQIGLALRILCGFGIEEIADAFLTNKETINKRLFRAKQQLREGKIKIGLPAPSEIESRLSSVLTTIYLLFNEGYYSISRDKPLHKELCLEAMRLCAMLIENKETDQPQVNALLSLMCFHASRFDARLDGSGQIILYEDQDTSRWNTDFISKGGYFLKCAAAGDTLSRYHLEAGIAYWSTQRTDTKEKWKNILQFYNLLLQMEYSPIAALNRTYALSKVYGKPAAILEAEKLDLTDNHFYFALLGELYTSIDDDTAGINFQKAYSLAKTQADKQAVQKKIDRLAGKQVQ
ncbi:MAG TPA: sigma-70 family RNA polymerase sigma factor [Puia sp.]|nr:sigma-70 family RNA polymerase sigma factor [Puia sp.]